MGIYHTQSLDSHKKPQNPLTKKAADFYSAALEMVRHLSDFQLEILCLKSIRFIIRMGNLPPSAP